MTGYSTRRSVPAVPACGYSRVQIRVPYVGGTDVPVLSRELPSHSTPFCSVKWCGSWTWSHLSHLSAQVAVPVARPGVLPLYVCGGVLVAKRKQLRTGKSTSLLFKRPATGTIGVPELREKFLCAYGAEAVFLGTGEAFYTLRIIGGNTPPRKDGTVPDKATTVRARGDYEGHPYGRSVAHIEPGPLDRRVCNFYLYVLETVKGMASRWASAIGMTTN